MDAISKVARLKALKVIISQNQNQIKSPLLRIPGELRNKIYGYILRSNYSLGANTACAHGSHNLNDKLSRHIHSTRRLLSLLEVCKQTYAESRLMIFRINPLVGYFVAVDNSLWKAPYDNLTPEQKSNVKVVKLRVSDLFFTFDPYNMNALVGMRYTLREAVKRLKHLHGLEELSIFIIHVVSVHKSKEIPEENLALLRQQVEDAVKREGKAIKVEILHSRVETPS